MVSPDRVPSSLDWQQDYESLRKHYLERRNGAKTLPGTEMTLREKPTYAIMEMDPYRKLLKMVAKLEKGNKRKDLYSLLCKLRAYDMGHGMFPSHGSTAQANKEVESWQFVDLTLIDVENIEIIDVDIIDLDILLKKKHPRGASDC